MASRGQGRCWWSWGIHPVLGLFRSQVGCFQVTGAALSVFSVWFLFSFFVSCRERGQKRGKQTLSGCTARLVRVRASSL